MLLAGGLTALKMLKLESNFLVGTFPQSISRLVWLRELQLSKNQFELQSRNSLSEILSSLLQLQTLDLGMSNENADLTRSIIQPTPPIACRVGEICEFRISTRTTEGLPLPHGGLRIQAAVTTEEDQYAELCTCSDSNDGSYVCTLPEDLVATSAELRFALHADREEFEPVRSIIDPTTGVESTMPTYPDPVIFVAPIQCNILHSHADTNGAECICESGYYHQNFGDSWSCDRCDPGHQPDDLIRTRCQPCQFGTFSADGQRCHACSAGFEPNRASAAESCSACDESSVSPDGVKCSRCDPDQVADSARTQCVCPATSYNSSQRGGNNVRCLSQGLRGTDKAAAATCVPCGDLECVACGGAHGLSVRTEFAVAQTDEAWLVFKCPFKGACVQREDERCKAGHTGILCAVCSRGYGLNRDECVECSATNSNPFAAGGLLAVMLVVAGLIYFWRRRGWGQSGERLSEGLIRNPLQSSPQDSRRSSSYGSLTRTTSSVVQRSTDVYTLLRVVYQPVRILVGYIQVVTQIGPVLDLEFPANIRAVFEALKPFTIDLQSILQLDCLSGGLLDFYATWTVRVAIIPALMLCVVGLQYCYERRRVGASPAAGIFKANAFVVVFLCYPGVCNQVCANVFLSERPGAVVAHCTLSCVSARTDCFVFRRLSACSTAAKSGRTCRCW